MPWEEGVVRYVCHLLHPLLMKRLDRHTCQLYTSCGPVSDERIMLASGVARLAFRRMLMTYRPIRSYEFVSSIRMLIFPSHKSSVQKPATAWCISCRLQLFFFTVSWLVYQQHVGVRVNTVNRLRCFWRDFTFFCSNRLVPRSGLFVTPVDNGPLVIVARNEINWTGVTRVRVSIIIFAFHLKCKHVPIAHHFWDRERYWSKMADSDHPTCTWRTRWEWPDWNFRKIFCVRKLESLIISCK